MKKGWITLLALSAIALGTSCQSISESVTSPSRWVADSGPASADSSGASADSSRSSSPTEENTRKLFEVCRLRGIPIFTFVNKMDRLGRDPLDLVDEIERSLALAPAPGPRATDRGPVDPAERGFSGFVFKIQANMDPSHRDRVAFVRVCSGRFVRGETAVHVQSGTRIRLARSTLRRGPEYRRCARRCSSRARRQTPTSQTLSISSTCAA